MTSNDVIVNSLTVSGLMLERYTADLKPPEYLHRPCGAANCAAWLIGHLVLTERNGLKRLGVTDMPELPAGFEQRFSREPAAPKASDFGDVTGLMPLFKRHRAMLIDAVKRATPEQLAQPLEKPHPMFATVGESANFIAMHVMMHAGQVTIIRRSLGRPPLV
jgi:hypothetical protein